MTVRAVKLNQTIASSKPDMMRALGLRCSTLEKRLKIRCHKIHTSNEPTVCVRKPAKKTMVKRMSEPARAME